MVDKFWTQNSMVILAVVYVRDTDFFPIGHGGGGCVEVVDGKLDGYFGCGVCNEQLLLPNKAWRGWWKSLDGDFDGYFGCGEIQFLFSTMNKQASRSVPPAPKSE